MLTVTELDVGELGIIKQAMRAASRAAVASIRRSKQTHGAQFGMSQSEARAATLKIFGFTTLALVVAGGSTVGFLALREKMRRRDDFGRGVRPPGVPLPTGWKKRW